MQISNQKNKRHTSCKVEAAAPTGVTPSLQGAMRTQQGKSLKRGRKPKNKGKGKKGTGKGDTSPQTIQKKVPPKKSPRPLTQPRLTVVLKPAKWPRVVSMLVTVGSLRFYQGSTMGAAAVDSSMEVVGIAKKILSVG